MHSGSAELGIHLKLSRTEPNLRRGLCALFSYRQTPRVCAAHDSELTVSPRRGFKAQSVLGWRSAVHSLHGTHFLSRCETWKGTRHATQGEPHFFTAPHAASGGAHLTQLVPGTIPKHQPALFRNSFPYSTFSERSASLQVRLSHREFTGREWDGVTAIQAQPGGGRLRG